MSEMAESEKGSFKPTDSRKGSFKEKDSSQDSFKATDSRKGSFREKDSSQGSHNKAMLLTPHQKTEIQQMFDLFDTDGSGTMELNEIRVVFWALGFQLEGYEAALMIADVLGITAQEAQERSLTKEEFLMIIADKISESDTAEQMVSTFKLFDTENKGFLLIKDLKRVAEEVSVPFTDEELEMIMADIDADGGGEVTCDEWIRVMMQNKG
jgi:Ca2+-binding EF-hand superfamily protein